MEHKTVTLDQAIQRGDTTITEVQLRKPKAGEMRGLNMADVLQMDVNALTKLLPRITDLTEKEVGDMDPADLLKAGVVVVGFLMGSQQEAYLTA